MLKQNIKIKYTQDKTALLNIGCGNIYSPVWNNIDFVKNKDITYWDIRKGLPYPDSSMDAVYSSHLLEHLSPMEADNLLTEISRVIKTNGVLRIVVPDLKRICEEYLICLNNAEKDPSSENSLKYDWIMLELIDQMVREKSGGLMRETINSKNFDKEYAYGRVGDIALSCASNNPRHDTEFIIKMKKIKRFLRSIISPNKDPRKTGEVHKWMYDSFSLSRLLGAHGFKNIKVTDFDKSLIKNWDLYQFDGSKFDPTKQKKPESIYIEGIKE